MQSPFKLSPKLDNWFIERYYEEFAAWATNFRKIGSVKSIVLKEGPFADPSPDLEVGPVLLQVKLLAKFDKRTQSVTIEPLGDQDERLIRNHVQKMKEIGIPSRAFWKEAPRAWIPGMPKVDPQ
jgi:hypothetical protein